MLSFVTRWTRRTVILGSLALLLVSSAVSTQESTPEAVPSTAYSVTVLDTRPFTEALLSELQVPQGFEVSVFAQGLDNPRWMIFGEDGTLYVSQRAMGTVVALTDTDADGAADGAARVVVSGMPLAHGLEIRDGHLYVFADKVITRAPIQPNGDIGTPETLIDNLPDSGQHSARTLAFGPDGQLYANIGSPCNACGNSTPEYAAMLRGTADFSTHNVFASGLRNTIGFDWHPVTEQMWGFDHGIDAIGDDTPPEELNLLERGNNYGWPYCYGDSVVNDFIPGNPPGTTKAAFCAAATSPTLPYQAHSAPIGFTFYTGSSFPDEYVNDAFVVMRGSWNRSVATGYKVVRVLFDDAGQPTGFEDFMSDFLIEDGTAEFGRPAGIVVAPDGSLLVSEDSNGIIYRIAFVG